MPHVEKSILNDLHYLAENLREADRQEIAAASTRPAIELLKMGFCYGTCKTVLADDNKTPLAVFGTVNVRDKIATVWMLSTEDFLKEWKFTFMKHARKEIEKLCAPYDRVFNYVYSKNEAHVKWLKHMGFDVHDYRPLSIGVNDEIFYYFEKVNKNV